MGQGLLAIMKGLLKHEQKRVNWMEDTPDTIRAKAAYNGGLEAINDFLVAYQKGSISKEFMDAMIKLGEKE